MKLTLVALVSAALTTAVPTRSVLDISDTDILQYALSLENLEHAFYQGALAKYDERDFARADLPSWVRGRLAQVASHEAQHASLLAGAIGPAAVKPCTYNFPYHDPASFAALAAILEGVGVSAYLGASPYVSDKTYLNVAGSILTTETRHQAWVNSAINGVQPWSGPEDTPLGFNQVYSIMASFVKRCPVSNHPLPLKVFPPLTAFPANAPPRTEVTYSFNGAPGRTYYAAYYSGLVVQLVKLKKKKATIPEGLLGTYYTVITMSPDIHVTDANTVAGPLISVIDFPASASD